VTDFGPGRRPAGRVGRGSRPPGVRAGGPERRL